MSVSKEATVESPMSRKEGKVWSWILWMFPEWDIEIICGVYTSFGRVELLADMMKRSKFSFISCMVMVWIALKFCLWRIVCFGCGIK